MRKKGRGRKNARKGKKGIEEVLENRKEKCDL